MEQSRLSGDRIIKLPASHPRIFDLYTLAITDHQIPYDHVYVYLLAEVLLDNTTKKKMLKEIVYWCQEHDALIHPVGVADIYAGTKPGSPARRLCIPFGLRKWSMQDYQEAFTILPGEFLQDVGRAILKDAGKERSDLFEEVERNDTEP
jgi:hypothetical protein